MCVLVWWFKKQKRNKINICTSKYTTTETNKKFDDLKLSAKEKCDKFNPNLMVGLRLRVGCVAKRKERKSTKFIIMRAHQNSTNRRTKFKIINGIPSKLIYALLLKIEIIIERCACAWWSACVRVCIFLCVCNACINKCTTHVFLLVSIAFFTWNKYFIILSWVSVSVCVISVAGIVNVGVSTKVHYPILTHIQIMVARDCMSLWLGSRDWLNWSVHCRTENRNSNEESKRLATTWSKRTATELLGREGDTHREILYNQK